MVHNHATPNNYVHTVSFFIFRTDFTEPKLLLHVHRKHKLLMMFGGHVEFGENPWETFLRELGEETGYAPSQLQVLQPWAKSPALGGEAAFHPIPASSSSGEYSACDFKHFWTDTAYALTVTGEPLGTPDEGESKDFTLVTYEELKNLSSEKVVDMWRNSALHIFENHLQGWVEVPVSSF